MATVAGERGRDRELTTQSIMHCYTYLRFTEEAAISLQVSVADRYGGDVEARERHWQWRLQCLHEYGSARSFTYDRAMAA